MSGTNLSSKFFWIVPVLAFSLVGCGLTQSVADGSKSVFNAVFYKQIKVLHLDFTAREALNTDSRENHSLSEPVVVRVYQLKDSQAFEKIVYEQLLRDGENSLKEDLLITRDVVVKPGGDAMLDVPLEAGAKFVGIAGLFRNPDKTANNWKLIIQRESLSVDKARIIELGTNSLRLLPVKD